MKNKKSLLIGLILAAVVVLFFSGVLQYLLLLFLNVEVEKFHFTMFAFSPTFTLTEYSNIYLNTVLFLFPILINLIILEFCLFLLGKLPLGVWRYSLIVCLVIMAGYIIVFTFYGLIELIIAPQNDSIWTKVIKLWELDGTQIYVFVSLTILAIFTYLQFLQKRLMQYLVLE